MPQVGQTLRVDIPTKPQQSKPTKPKKNPPSGNEPNKVESSSWLENVENDQELAVKPSGSDDEFKVVCYFTNWAWYRQEPGSKFLPEDIDADLCTHIVYGFAVLDVSTLTIKPHDPWADIDNSK